jgi:hypothetical protein
MTTRYSAALAAAVEAVADRLAGGGWDRTGAAQLGEGGLRADALGVVAGQDQQLGGGVRADAELGDQLGRVAGG